MSLTDLFVYAVMLCVAPIFLVILAVALLISSPVWLPYELYKWWERRA